MYNIIPLIIILVSLIVIIIIISRKFSALASLDVENIPAEKEAKFKEQIVSHRFRRSYKKISVFLLKLVSFVWPKISRVFKAGVLKLHNLKDKYEKEKEGEFNQIARIISLFEKVESLYKKEMIDEAEKTLIEIIGIDSKNIQAFEMLGNLYFDDKKYEEAKQTYKHIVKLLENTDQTDKLAEIYYDLGGIERSVERYPEAIKYFKLALKNHPNNPRYLDSLLEISIINKDKALALEVYGKLKESNSENKKLSEFKAQIDEI